MTADSSTAESGLLVLVVDDDPMVRRLAAALFTKLGARVIDVGTARQALQVLTDRTDVGLVFSDVQMPGDDGYFLAREVTRTFPGLPTVLSSGQTITEVPPGTIAINKPWRLAELRTLLSDIERRQS